MKELEKINYEGHMADTWPEAFRKMNLLMERLNEIANGEKDEI